MTQIIKVRSLEIEFGLLIPLVHDAGQINYSDLTPNSPQKVAFRKGNGTPYFREI